MHLNLGLLDDIPLTVHCAPVPQVEGQPVAEHCYHEVGGVQRHSPQDPERGGRGELGPETRNNLGRPTVIFFFGARGHPYLGRQQSHVWQQFVSAVLLLSIQHLQVVLEAGLLVYIYRDERAVNIRPDQELLGAAEASLQQRELGQVGSGHHSTPPLTCAV